MILVVFILSLLLLNFPFVGQQMDHSLISESISRDLFAVSIIMLEFSSCSFLKTKEITFLFACNLAWICPGYTLSFSQTVYMCCDVPFQKKKQTFKAVSKGAEAAS